MGAAVLAVALLALAVWVWLVGLHGMFWRSGPYVPVEAHGDGPPVAVVVPARDEAGQILDALGSLLAQDYRGRLRIWLVDDGSSDGTGALARGLGDSRLTVLDGRPRPGGWSGKLWAVSQGIDAARAWLDAEADAASGYLLLTDADIVHAPSHVGSLVGFARADRRDMVSEMVALHCASAAERALVPAFVFFFQMLYPFRWVGRTDRRIAAAAGGVVLIARGALEAIGGIGAIRGALIDDVALAGAVKRTGARIWLGHARLARSVRPYERFGDVWAMISRCAYVQLRHSPTLLAGCILGMALVWLAPLAIALFGHGAARLAAAAALALSLASFLPTLAGFGLSAVRALTLPVVAGFYMAATIASALAHHLGRGLVWKGRAYGGEAAS